MHIVRTVVTRGEQSDVRFEGDHGESVTVTLADRQRRTDDQLMLEARDVLLQAARYVPDDVPFAPGRNRALQCYILEYRDGDEVLAIPPVDLPDLDAVRAEIRQSAMDLWKDALSNAKSPTGWAVRAKDASGAIVASIDFDELQHEPVE